MILSLVGDNVLSWQYCLPKKSLTFLLMDRTRELGDLLPYAVNWEHWQASGGSAFRSQTEEFEDFFPSRAPRYECDLCGVRSQVFRSSSVLFCTMEMCSRPTRLPNTQRVRDAIAPHRVLRHCKVGMCCYCSILIKADTRYRYRLRRAGPDDTSSSSC